MNAKQEKLLKLCLSETLPYIISCEYRYSQGGLDKGERRGVVTGRMIDSFFGRIVIGETLVTDIKPYLRQMGSMSEDERIDYEGTFIHFDGLGAVESKNTFDWLNANGFDHRGLIEMGIALPATEEIAELYKGRYANSTMEYDSEHLNGFGIQGTI